MVFLGNCEIWFDWLVRPQKEGRQWCVHVLFCRLVATRFSATVGWFNPPTHRSRASRAVATAQYSFLAHQFTHNKVNIPWHLTLTQIFSNLENFILAFCFQQLFNISIIPAAHLCQFYIVKIDVLLGQIRYLNVPCVTRAKDFITHRAISIINLFLYLFKNHLVLLSSLKNLMEIWWHIRILVFRPLSSH